jgi:hypothetical protein
LQHSKNGIFTNFAPAGHSLARSFRGHARGELPQLVTDERQEVGSSLAVTCGGRIEEAGQIGTDP